MNDRLAREERTPKAVAIGFWQGFTYAFRGLHFIFFRHPDLVRIWIFPILITIAVLVAALWGVWTGYQPLVEWLWPTPEDGFLWGVHWLVELLVAVTGFILAFVVTMLLTPLLAAPFNGKLSAEVERLVTGNQPPPSTLPEEVRFILRSIGLEALKLLFYLLATTPLWVLSLLLPPLSPIGSALGFWLTAMHAAVDFTDSPQERRRRGVIDTYAFAFRHFWPMFGFGTGVFGFLFIPFVNLLFLPAVVTGGTLLYLDLAPDHPLPEQRPVRH